MKVFTIKDNSVTDGAQVSSVTIKGAGVTVPAIIIGEEGRGRSQGVLPVAYASKQEQAEENKRLLFANVGQSRSGKPKLFELQHADSHEQCIVVFRTTIGFRGGNSHTGDVAKIEEYEQYGETKKRYTFAAFPGSIIVRGEIAQGGAGRMGSGSQFVAIMPKGIWFRVARSGRLYGAHPSHYFMFDGEKIIGGLTWDERSLLD